MKSKKWKSIRIIVPILLMSVVLVAVIISTALNWKVTVKRMKASLKEQVNHQTYHLNDKIESKMDLIQGLSATCTQEDISDLYYIKKKLAQSAEQTDFDELSFVYPDGTLYRDDGATADVVDRDYFINALSGKTDVAYVEDRIDGNAKVVISTPVIAEDKICGVLMGTYNMNTVRAMFEKFVVETSNLSYICDSTGKYLIGTKEAEQVMEKYQPGITNGGGFMDVLALSDFSKGSIEEIAQAMKNGESGNATYKYFGEDRYTIYEPLGINDWYVIAVLPENMIYEEAIQSARITYIILAIVMVSVTGIIFYLIVRERMQLRNEKKRADEMKYRLEHDELTGLLVEGTFLKLVEKKCKEIQPGEYCLIYMDFNKFKLINDMFGYEKGNELLRVTAYELQEMADLNDGLCGRISGDKFVLFIPYKEELIKQFYGRKLREPRIVQTEIYLHYGIYVIKHTDIPVAQMVDCAQLAQKAVKGSIDNFVSFYDEQVKTKIMREQEIVDSMSQALKNGEFIIYLQPQYNYREDKISGAEALVRWKSPTKGLISPGEFIPVFETNGFITKLDENVWEQVCKLQRKWLDAGITPLPISVNVSRADLLRGSVAEKLMELIKKYDLTTDMIRVEITETAYMDNPQQLIMEIDKLKDNGLLVEMDDFGSGYSSLNMLKDVPIQVLKTDLKFLAGEGIGTRKESILGSVVNMAHQMGLSVIAEGVETKEQADYLLNLECVHMQGYYFSRPIPVDEFEQLVYSA